MRMLKLKSMHRDNTVFINPESISAIEQELDFSLVYLNGTRSIAIEESPAEIISKMEAVVI